MSDQAARCAAFHKLHEAGCFVIPNPWDRGSAMVLEQLGFPALASSSAGFAFTRGRPDSATAVSCDEVLDHLRDLCAATRVPINADFQAGYADHPDGVARNVERCVATGVAGLSIEDLDGDGKLYDFALAVERIKAARAAIDRTGTGVVLTARSEANLIGWPDALAESIRRLQAFAEAGADVLYAPGLRDRAAMAAVIAAVAPRPVNILISGKTDLRVADVAALGARRISVGSALARVAWSAFLHAAERIAADGEFGAFAGLVSTRELSARFSGNNQGAAS